MERSVAPSFVVFLLLAPSWPSRAADIGAVEAGSAEMSPPAAVKVDRAGPGAMLSSAELRRLEDRVQRTHRPTHPASLKAPGAEAFAPPAADTLASEAPAATQPDAAGDFALFRRTSLKDAVPSGFVATVAEPCVAQAGEDVLVTGNWFAGMSSDGGETFTNVSPFTAFPSVNGGFCCDQVPAYDPGRDLFFWMLMYVDDGVSNTLRLAIANGKAGFEARQWVYYDFKPQQVGMPSGYSFDYPRIALGANYLYITSNIFAVNDGPFAASVIMRVPLDDLADHRAFTFGYLRVADHASFTPVSGAGTTIYWASQDPLYYRTRIYRWAESETTIYSNDVDVSSYGIATGVCPGPDGNDWCGRADDRVAAGWVAGGVIGFMWNASQDGAHPYPYVRVIRVSESTRVLIDQPDICNGAYAFQYPAVGVNARGHIAGTLFYGGSAYYPSLATFVLDDLSQNPAVAGWELYTVANGTGGPSENKWGDFLCAAPHRPDGTTWDATGYVISGVPASIDPTYVWVGRQRDAPTTCPNGTPCDDGNSCTVGDHCEAGACVPGAPKTCVASDACHVAGTCDPGTGACSNPPALDRTACSDGNSCTVGDHCEAGACTPGTPKACVASDPCHVAGTCDPGAGSCSNPPLTIDAVLTGLDARPDTTGCESRQDRKLLDAVDARIGRARAKLLAARRKPSTATRALTAAHKAISKAQTAVRNARKTSPACRGVLADQTAAIASRIDCLR